jgi:hypothetical protein
MVADRFAALTRHIGSRASRRLALGLAAIGVFTIAVPDAEALRCSKNKPCPECFRCRKRRCRPKTGGTLTCGVGACNRSVQQCVNGTVQNCVPGAPSAEFCNGIDDDCDGIVDNGCP